MYPRGEGVFVGVVAATAAEADAADSAARKAAGERVGELRGFGFAASAESGRGDRAV